MRAGHRLTKAFPLLACGLVLLCLACSRTATVVLDNIPSSVVSAFDRTRATEDPDLRITSIADGAVIPRNHSYPLFEWGDTPAGGVFLLEMRARRAGLDVFLKGTSWRPQGHEFERFLPGREVRVRLFRLGGGEVARSRTVRLAIARRPLGDRIAFRVVQPLFDPALPNGLEVFSFGERRRSTLAAFQDTCVGCHGYGAASVLLNVKRGSERRLVSARRTGDVVLLRHRDLGAFSFFAVSPDGRFAAYVRAPVGDLVLRDTVVEPFDYPYSAADIHVFDTATGATWPLAGASDPGLVEDMPAFSPDGTRLIFSRYRMEGSEGAGTVPGMELVELSFNEGRGGQGTPLPGTTERGSWHYFARYSPDGRWISFCRGDARHGVYARRSSDICLMSTADRSIRRLRASADGAMDSWHSWSGDSHWLAFASNREAGGMTSLFLVHLDDRGDDDPPVKLVGFDALKVNTPQFISGSLDLSSLAGLGPFVETTFAAP